MTSAEHVQKTMSDYLKTGADLRASSCQKVYSKLNLKQKSMYNRMRFVELSNDERKQLALSEYKRPKNSKQSSTIEVLRKIDREGETVVDEELNGRLLKILSLITPNFVKPTPREFVNGKPKTHLDKIHELQDQICKA